MREGILKNGRLGRFGLPYDLIIGNKAWFIHTIQTYVIILRAQDNSEIGGIEYIGTSYLFEFITGDGEIPWYKIELNDSDHSIESITRQMPNGEAGERGTLSTKDILILSKLFRGR